MSEKRRHLMSEATPWREAFRARIGRCEVCLRPADPEYLTLHEIARGCHRQQALMAPFALLCVHWIVDTGRELKACHAEVQREPLARQLARLYLVRASDFDLSAFHELTHRRYPDQSDVDAEVALILNTREGVAR